eukprot:5787005-Pyramimonas_sp.AAC.1
MKLTRPAARTDCAVDGSSRTSARGDRACTRRLIRACESTGKLHGRHLRPQPLRSASVETQSDWRDN